MKAIPSAVHRMAYGLSVVSRIKMDEKFDPTLLVGRHVRFIEFGDNTDSHTVLISMEVYGGAPTQADGMAFWSLYPREPPFGKSVVFLDPKGPVIDEHKRVLEIRSNGSGSGRHLLHPPFEKIWQPFTRFAVVIR